MSPGCELLRVIEIVVVIFFNNSGTCRYMDKDKGACKEYAFSISVEISPGPFLTD